MKVPVGINHEMQIWTHHNRSPEQFQAIQKLVAQDNFDFAVFSNPFTSDFKVYTGPFVFMYYTKDGILHAARIGKRGNVLQQHLTRSRR